jgi:hypothetical protein
MCRSPLVERGGRHPALSSLMKFVERVLLFLGLRELPGAPVEVPRLTGLRRDTARQRCLEDGLLFAVADPDLGPQAVVVAQAPPRQTLVDQYTMVWVTVALHPPRWHPRPMKWWVRRVIDSI